MSKCIIQTTNKEYVDKVRYLLEKENIPYDLKIDYLKEAFKLRITDPTGGNIPLHNNDFKYEYQILVKNKYYDKVMMILNE